MLPACSILVLLMLGACCAVSDMRRPQPSGLITPVVRDAGNKSILAISAEAKDMAAREMNATFAAPAAPLNACMRSESTQKHRASCVLSFPGGVWGAGARANKLMPEEFTGGCTSVSNLGMFDISEFIAGELPGKSCTGWGAAVVRS